MTIEKCINEFAVDDVIFEEGSTGRELFVMMLVMVIGGRIIPSFTSNWLGRQADGRANGVQSLRCGGHRHVRGCTRTGLPKLTTTGRR